MEKLDICNEEESFAREIFMKLGIENNIDSCLIGKGYTGTIWKISDNFCLKVSTKNDLTDIPESFKSCENLCVPLKSVVSQSGKYIGHILKYLNMCSLEFLIKNNIKLTEEQARIILYDILKGVNVIHENGYVHRDFHPGNIMLTKDNKKINAVIIDFDDMQPMKEETKVCFRYNGYQAPEIVFDDDTYDGKSEMFTLGIIFWELILGKCPFGGYDFFGKIIEESWDKYTENSQYYNDRVKEALKTAPQYLKRRNEISDECFDLLRSLLDFNKNNRMTANELLNHPFLTKDAKKSFKNKIENNIYNKEVSDMERE